MPLIHSSSDSAFKTNVGNLMHEVGKSPHVKSRNQALAIAYATQRRGREEGGPVIDPQNPDLLRQRLNQMLYDRNLSRKQGTDVYGSDYGNYNAKIRALRQQLGGKADGGPVDPEAQKIMDDNKFRNLLTYYMGKKRAEGGKAQNRVLFDPRPLDGRELTPQERIDQGFDSPLIRPKFNQNRPPAPYQGPWSMVAAEGGAVPGFALGGLPGPQGSSMPWFAKAEARNMTHAGPINSIVPGRTDKHNMSVKSGSYVIPADTVSHVGQNNSSAGHAILSKMFSSGPYGVGGQLHPAHSIVPKLKMRDFGGGVQGRGEPVDIVTAGGEFVVPPETVQSIGKGSLDIGHKILDKWVMNMRKDHVQTLKNLPPPAKK